MAVTGTAARTTTRHNAVQQRCSAARCCAAFRYHFLRSLFVRAPFAFSFTLITCRSLLIIARLPLRFGAGRTDTASSVKATSRLLTPFCAWRCCSLIPFVLVLAPLNAGALRLPHLRTPRKYLLPPRVAGSSVALPPRCVVFYCRRYTVTTFSYSTYLTHSTFVLRCWSLRFTTRYTRSLIPAPGCLGSVLGPFLRFPLPGLFTISPIPGFSCSGDCGL